MLSTPSWRGRPAGLSESRPPAYRRSTSLGVAAASPVRARPASMVTLSTGRVVLAAPLPRRDYDPCMSRALAALEVPGARVPRVLQGRRLYHSSSSSTLGPSGSSVNSCSLSSPRGLSTDQAALRPRPRPLDSGRLARSRSGIFGESLERPEVPLTRTRTTVFGRRASSVLREDTAAEADSKRAVQQRRPWSTAVTEDPGKLQDVTSGIRKDTSPGRDSGASRGRNAAGSVPPIRSSSRARDKDVETGSVAPTDGASTTAPGALGSVESTPPPGKELGATDSRNIAEAGSDRGGRETFVARPSVATTNRVEPLVTQNKPSGILPENGTRLNQGATSEADVVCEIKQGAVPKPDSSRSTDSDKQTASQPEKQTAKPDDTANKAAKEPSCHDKMAVKMAAHTAELAAENTATSPKNCLLEKKLVNDVLSVSDQRATSSSEKPKVSAKDSVETNLPLHVPVKSEQMKKEQTGREKNGQVTVSAEVSAERVDSVMGDKGTSVQAAGTNAHETKLEVEPAAKVKKPKKKRPTKKLLDVDKEELPTAKCMEADNTDQKVKSVQDKPKEETIAKKIEVTDDINNNIYIKKLTTYKNISKRTESPKDHSMPKLVISSTEKPAEVNSVNNKLEDCCLTTVNKHETKIATKEKCVTAQTNTETLATKDDELKASLCSTTKSSAARRFDKWPSPAENKLDVSTEVIAKHSDGEFGTGENYFNAEIYATESSAKFTAAPNRTEASSVKPDVIAPARHTRTNKPNTALPTENDRSAEVTTSTADTVPIVNLGVTSKTSSASPDADGCRPEKVTVTRTAGAARSTRESHRSDTTGVGSATGTDSSPAAVKPDDSAGTGGGQELMAANVKHRHHAVRKSGLTDKEKALNRNAAVIGDRLIVGELQSGVPWVSGQQAIESVQSGDKNVRNHSSSSTSGAAITDPEKERAKHMSTVMQKDADTSDTTRPVKNSNSRDAKALRSINDQKPSEMKHITNINADTVVAKKKVKIVKKKLLPSEAKQIKLTTVEPAKKLIFPTKNITNLSPFLRADQEKKTSKNSKISNAGSKIVDTSGNNAKEVGSTSVTMEKPVKLPKKNTSKTPNASKRSKKHGELEVHDSKTKHSVENVCGRSKRVPSGGLKPTTGTSKPGTKRVTKGKKSSSVQLDSDKLKSKSDDSSSSESCSSSEYDSELELSSVERAKRKIREDKEREEARKIEKFRRRGQRAKLKMERLKMEDDPEEYIKTPGNLRFAFMIKQDDWMRKQKEEAENKERESSQVDGAAPAGPVTSSAAIRRPSADIDESPFDRRLGPLGGPPPKFRQYALHDFRLLRVLGEGAFGKVMLARMKDTRNYFAIKCLRKDKIVSDEDVEDTLIERKILTLGTNQPYLCHLFCTFQSPSHLFFVLEFLNGGDLNFHLGQMGRFSPELTRFYAAELVCGLRFLHKRGIIYRDLKLDNVLLDHEGHVRIADFGMCKMQIFLDRTAGAFCGTVDYMAPEVVSGKNYNQSVDWWSFGIMLYEMLVGLTPFIGLDEDELFWAIRTEQPFYPRFLERDATEIIKWLLVKEPALRLGSPECPAGGICSQPFFRRVDWHLVERKQHDPPPFRPTLLTMADCRYFEDDYTALPARLTAIPDHVLSELRQDRFANFDYTNPNMTD